MQQSHDSPALFNSAASAAVRGKSRPLWQLMLGMGVWTLTHDGNSGAAAGAVGLLYRKIRTNAEWDAKPYIEQKFNYTAADLDRDMIPIGDGSGAGVRADVLGNVNYGYMLATFGLREDVALAAANAPGDDVGRTNDPMDDAAVSLGFEMATSHPSGISSEVYYALIVQTFSDPKGRPEEE